MTMSAVMMASVMHMMIMPVLSPAMGYLMCFSGLRIRQYEARDQEKKRGPQQAAPEFS
jgi:hypothetical protein